MTRPASAESPAPAPEPTTAPPSRRAQLRRAGAERGAAAARRLLRHRRPAITIPGSVQHGRAAVLPVPGRRRPPSSSACVLGHPHPARRPGPGGGGRGHRPERADLLAGGRHHLARLPGPCAADQRDRLAAGGDLMFGVVAWALGSRGIVRPLLAGGIASVIIWLIFVKALGCCCPAASCSSSRRAGSEHGSPHPAAERFRRGGSPRSTCCSPCWGSCSAPPSACCPASARP